MEKDYEAEKLFEAALRLLSVRLSARHPFIGRLLVHRGKLRAAQGRRRDAIEDFENAIAIFREAGVLPQQRLFRIAQAEKSQLA